MSGYGRTETSAEVWAVIKARHPEMRVFSTFSAPDGDPNGNPMQGKMFTSYGFRQGDYPVIEAETTWDIVCDENRTRTNMQHKYWLCIPMQDNDL